MRSPRCGRTYKAVDYDADLPPRELRTASVSGVQTGTTPTIAELGERPRVANYLLGPTEPSQPDDIVPLYPTVTLRDSQPRHVTKLCLPSSAPTTFDNSNRPAIQGCFMKKISVFRANLALGTDWNGSPCQAGHFLLLGPSVVKHSRTNKSNLSTGTVRHFRRALFQSYVIGLVTPLYQIIIECARTRKSNLFTGAIRYF